MKKRTFTPSSERAPSGQTTAFLRTWVERLAVPRNYWAQPDNNRRVGDLLASTLSDLGYETRLQGEYRNVLALPAGAADRPTTLVCAHYDSVRTTPGADDNASGLAVLLWCAQQLAQRADTQVGFVAFNLEEDGLLGSADFARWLTEERPFEVAGAHVLEMVGYRSTEPGSQRLPTGLPLTVPDRADFIALLANGPSQALLDAAERAARAEDAAIPVISVKTMLGLERWLPVLHRSDHSPLWKQNIPALLWTDTAEFRNPHYHRETDTPDTLDYAFMAGVAELLLAALLPTG